MLFNYDHLVPRPGGELVVFLPSVTVQSPNRGVVRWAWQRSVQHRAKFWVGAVAFSVTLSLTGAFVVLPPNPTIAQKVLAAAGILTATTILVMLATYIPALLAAPFQQRNALCRRIGA
jgi:hypothetical protein